MTNMNRTATMLRITFGLFVLAMGCLAPMAQAQPCSSLTGTWGFHLTGTNIGRAGEAATGQSVSVAGVFTVNPTGLTVTATTNGNTPQTGIISQEVFTGLYTITTTGPAANLGGTITLKSASAARTNFDFYCSAGGNEIFLISTDASPLVLSGVARKVQ